MRRNGTNSKVTFQERLVLPRVRTSLDALKSCPRTKMTTNVSSFSLWIFGTRLNDCTWWRPKDLSWLGPQWAVSFLAERFCSEQDQVFWCGVGLQPRRCAAHRFGCPTAECRPIASWMTPSFHSKHGTSKAEVGLGCGGALSA